jgi:ABC-type uncharacterized transport system permease subunit
LIPDENNVEEVKASFAGLEMVFNFLLILVKDKLFVVILKEVNGYAYD